METVEVIGRKVTDQKRYLYRLFDFDMQLLERVPLISVVLSSDLEMKLLIQVAQSRAALIPLKPRPPCKLSVPT